MARPTQFASAHAAARFGAEAKPIPTPPSRKNRRVLTTWQDDAALKQLKMLAVELEVSQQSLVAEGLNYVLSKYGRPSAAT